MSKKLVLIDGHSILFRAFYGMPPVMTAPDGTHTNAVYGFLTILHKVIETEQPDDLACAFDLAAPTFRHKKYPAYKGTRKPAPEEFHEQVPVMQALLKDMGIPVVTCEGWEADDILGTLARQAEEKGMKAMIISGDRDLLQLASDGTEIVMPKTQKGKTTYKRYKPEDVEKAYGVTPKKFIELKALMGDTSDNVPGLPGVGPKTAEKILKEYGSIENAYEHRGEVKPKKASKALGEHYDLLEMSLDLVTIRTNAPVTFDEKTFALGNIHNDKAKEDFRKLGFKSLMRYFDAPKEEEKKASPLRTPVVVTDFAEADRILEMCMKKKHRGVSILWEKGIFYGAAVAADEGVYVFQPEGFLTEAVIRDFLKRLVESEGCTASGSVKRLLRFTHPSKKCDLFDDVIAAYLLDPLKADWSLDAIATGRLDLSVPSREELIGKKGIAAYLDNARKEGEEARKKAEDVLTEIAGEEAEIALRAEVPLRKALDEQKMTDLFEKVEMPLTPVLAEMEDTGIKASTEALKEYGDALTHDIERLKGEIYTAAGEEFNINSPKQLGHILFEKMGLKGGKKTKTGYSTAADVLEKLAPDYPIVENVLEYRTLSKLKSTYADGLPQYIADDGRIHTIFHQTVTATGRLSSSDPNLQNIPMRENLGRQIRKCFTPKEGCVFVDADYSQIELRILAHMSGDENLIEAYREAEDIHRMTASKVFHVPLDEVTDQQRRNAKAVNFGIVYGISSFGLSQNLSISRKEAQSYIDEYFAIYPQIKTFLDGLVESAKKNGYAVSLYGRRRPIPELSSRNFMQRQFGERAAMNSPIQGTAADIMKIAMIRVYERLKKERLKSRLILQIHDELLIESPKEEADYVKKLLAEEMEHAADLKVKLEVDCKIGTDWYNAK